MARFSKYKLNPARQKTKLLLILLLVIAFRSNGQLYINEFMASNTSTIKDPDFNNDADWIEIYNAGDKEINLDGYSLTDNFDIPGKWAITNVTIAAKSFAVFWADDYNTGTHTNFKLAAEGEEIGLFAPDQSAIDTIVFGVQNPDISTGRNHENPEIWGRFSEATPGSANTTEFFSDFVLNEPRFSLRGGLFIAPQTVELTNSFGGEIRFTTDGSEPTIQSILYFNPINFDTTTIIRARIFKPGQLPGPVITNTYFIGNKVSLAGLPVVSIASEPANFWDPQAGIYVQNFKPDWEIPVNIELFENDNSDRAAFNEKAGVKINGLYSWQLPQKMLGVYFRKQYGNGTLDNTLFYDSKRAGFKTFALRASGNDWSNTLMRDILAQNATQLNMNLDISHFRWCTVYFNGRYMGIHNFREKIETDYIEKHYGLAEGTFDMVENEDYPECGDLVEYNQLKALFSEDLSVQANFDAVAEKMDIENFTNLVIAEAAAGNSSIDHNVMAWKPKNTGKWRWILMDIDRGYFTVTSQMISFYVGQTSWPFGRLMLNSEYKKYFGLKLADHLYTSFQPDRMKQLIDEHKTAIEAEIPRHVERWLGTTSSYGNAMPSVDYWRSEVDKIKAYVEQRPKILLNDLKTYGFTGTANLSVSVIPENAGTLKLNGLIIPNPNVQGLYLRSVDANLVAEAKAGFRFLGWKELEKKILIPKESEWKYLDDGSDQGKTWTDTTFNDSDWKTGQAELGYGDGDENTNVDFGPDKYDKFITTYFRHEFTLTADELNSAIFTISLLKDDGAVVYLNGTEVLRANMPSGEIGYKTLASVFVNGANETTFSTQQIDKSRLKIGKNVFAVEIHQNEVSSSDISFDLEFSCNILAGSNYLTTNTILPFNLSDDKMLQAVFESVTACVIPPVIDEDFTLSKDCSPYIANSDVTIKRGATLTIEPGVEIHLSPGNNIFIHGNIEANGTETDQVIFRINPQYKEKGWGALNFWNTSDTSKLVNVVIEDATIGPVPNRIGAINGYYTNLILERLTLENTLQNPISARYSDVSLTNSYIHSNFTGDLINIKYGKAKIENCTFVGNAEFDSDGIDYDGIEGGIIRNTRLLNIVGNNADAIDIGEEALNVIIDSIQAYNVFDKGISVGQQSSVIVTNSEFVNCKAGFGIKDSSSAFIDHCIFYGNEIPIHCYEKNPGRAGGNAVVRNSILSNSVEASFESDNQSTFKISNSFSDNTLLPEGFANKFGNPLFTDPIHYDFSLQQSSPAILAGSDNGKPVDLGAKLPRVSLEPDVLISQVYINPLNTLNPEFVALYNPSAKTIDLSGYSFPSGISDTIPAGTILEPGNTLYVVSDMLNWVRKVKQIVWEEGKLSNEGEGVELRNSFGMVADFIRYSSETGWPAQAFNADVVMNLKSSKLDNHFGENWEALSLWQITSVKQETKADIVVYPNPATERINVLISGQPNQSVQLFSSLGLLIYQSKTNAIGEAFFDVSALNEGIYLVKAGSKTAKVMVVWSR